ncbi:hypothetical protein JOB18_047920 [Solea senegalensis]|uniref:THAP domain-containing protein 1 n=1 Tax=Solea senegalensis TaxID=28829 RepID=A0AAV6S206_SOLSE|nr:uncharacterized protein LOC122783164 isoform X2 [Solea senegalensis]KAG7511364.1 hypothetical protein JOB18_047920 [Solea senegalensis]
MPSFDVIDKVELFLRTKKYPVGASKSSKARIRAASKHFFYKDDCLWRQYRGRLLKVVRSDEEMREILSRYHNDNNHAGQVRMKKEIMLMYYWVGVTEATKTWIKDCAVCRSQSVAESSKQPVQFCLAYGCDASSYICPELGFYRFPKEAEQRQKWLTVAQRDEGSLRFNSCLCSQHFEASCFTLSEEGQLTLSLHAVPTVTTVAEEDKEARVPSDEDFVHSDNLEDPLSLTAAVAAAAAAAAAHTTDASETTFTHSDVPVQLQEHQYSLPAPRAHHRNTQTLMEDGRRELVVEQSFSTYNHIARYLSHRVLPMLSKKSRVALKKMAKRFDLVDGVLVYTRVSPPARVPRSREEVNAVLQQFHDNQGHYGHGICLRDIAKHFYWSSMSRDLNAWIFSCHTCVTRTKRKWLRCSIHTCNNCCGPVERGLGLTFHRFPLHRAALLAQWLKAVGRAHWSPRLSSSICSKHFTDDCFDRSGDKVALRPDAVPTLLVHSSSAVTGPGAYFAKYDAVELYLRTRTYPPGLSFVEKNTFRRFCKKFVIKDDQLHMVKGERVCVVLRSRQQVEDALSDYHNDLNHLDANKCLRLLNERFFWKTMRPDVMQWISSCSECNSKKTTTTATTAKRPGNCRAPHAGDPETLLRSSETHEDSGRDDDYDDDDDDDDDGAASAEDEEKQPPPDSEVMDSMELMDESTQPTTPINRQPRVPVSLQGQSSARDQPEPQIQPEDQEVTVESQGRARTKHGDKVQLVPSPGFPAKSQQQQPASPSSGQKKQHQNQNHGGDQRSRELEAGSFTSSSCGLEPVVAPSNKPWPVFTIASSVSPQQATPPPDTSRSADPQRSSSPRARTVVQLCNHAKVKVKPAVDGADAQWAEIQEGMVVYVCFFHGATEDVVQEMAFTLMSTKLFRKHLRHMVSVLDLPGSVLFVPQDSLLGEPAPNRRMQYRGGCERWWGAQLFSTLVLTCRELMQNSGKSMKAGATVEHGVYGQKQEIALNSAEPLTHLLEF